MRGTCSANTSILRTRRGSSPSSVISCWPNNEHREALWQISSPLRLSSGKIWGMRWTTSTHAVSGSGCGGRGASWSEHPKENPELPSLLVCRWSLARKLIQQCIQATDFMHCEGSPCWVKCKVAEMCMWGRAKNIMHEGLEVRASYYNRFR